jgi:hypothetical protein
MFSALAGFIGVHAQIRGRKTPPIVACVESATTLARVEVLIKLWMSFLTAESAEGAEVRKDARKRISLRPSRRNMFKFACHAKIIMPTTEFTSVEAVILHYVGRPTKELAPRRVYFGGGNDCATVYRR